MNTYFWKSEKLRNNSSMLPDSIRALIVGRSGCGKTSVLMRLLLEENLLDYNKLFICGKSLHQIEYQILKYGFENRLDKQHIVNLLKINDQINELNLDPIDLIKTFGCVLADNMKGNISIQCYENSCEIPDPKEFNKNDKNLIVFDDIMCDKNQSAADSFYTRARHNNIDCFYIAQNFYKLPRQTIRCNSNFMIFFKLSKKDVDNIFHDSEASADFKSISTFREFCDKAWSEPYGFIVIDKDKKELKHRYRNKLELE